jgi:hypothetical protein
MEDFQETVEAVEVKAGLVKILLVKELVDKVITAETLQVQVLHQVAVAQEQWEVQPVVERQMVEMV